MPEIKFRELKVVRVMNGYMVIPEAGRPYTIFTPTETKVALDISGLVALVRGWASVVEAEAVKVASGIAAQNRVFDLTPEGDPYVG